MAEIFVSYRTDDSAYPAAEIHGGMVEHFGAEQVFRDCNSMLPGTVYPTAIRAAVNRCDVMLAVIGPHWLDALDQGGRRRIDDQRDWVRQELSQALRRGIPVVPVLLDGAVLPAAERLPDDVRGLTLGQAIRVRHSRLRDDVAELADGLARLVPGLVLRVRPAERSAQHGWVQNNTPAAGGVVYAAQGGSQMITTHHGEPR